MPKKPAPTEARTFSPEDIAEIEREAKQAEETAQAARQKLEAARAALKQQTVQKFLEQMDQLQITVQDLAAAKGIALNSATPKPRKEAEKAPPKFKNPTTGETHSGRGQLPAWLKEARDAGKLEEFRINK